MDSIAYFRNDANWDTEQTYLRNYVHFAYFRNDRESSII
nr:MAG TPA: hypothetical protein [Caudoviricetes sp.]